MLTAADLMDPAGNLPATPVRLHNVARICGVSLWRRAELLKWLEKRVPYNAPPTSGPWTAAPLAGTWPLDAVAAALRAGAPEFCHYCHGRPVPSRDLFITAAGGPAPPG
jgi:hypothetical protein